MPFDTFSRYLCYSRFPRLREKAWPRVRVEGTLFRPADSATRILFGGDVSFDRELRFSPYGCCKLKGNRNNGFFQKGRKKILKVMTRALMDPRYYSARLQSYNYPELLIKTKENEKFCEKKIAYHHSEAFTGDLPELSSHYGYPFEKISSFLSGRDLVVANLESPLARSYRICGLLISDAGYAEALREAGISFVSLANNHIFDAGENGFLETLDHLKAAGIAYTGAGRNREEAREGRTLDLKGNRITVLNYTNYCNSNFISVAAEYPGILPMDRSLVIEDIEKAKKKSDFVFVSLHWGVENQPNVHPKQIEYAHAFIDAGADAIIGHHSHIPHGIEIYKNKPIIYSLGNFIFGRSQSAWKDNLAWGDNYLAEIMIDEKALQGLIIYPISGQGEELFQPEVLTGDRADAVLHELQVRSAVFKTGIAVENHVGYINLKVPSVDWRTS